MQNILELSGRLNWVDILVFIVFLRLVFISLRQGLGIEFFKLLATICGAYLALHYYFLLASFLNGRAASKSQPELFLELTAYALLFFLGYLFFWALRFFTFRFLSAEVNSELSKWGGLVFGVLRAFLLSSLILFAILVPKSAYFKESVRYSLSGNYFLKVAPSVYTFIWESIVSKFNSGEEYNSAVREVCAAEAKQKNKNK
jgi:uncharacterized membrane protein required for colicin V production